MLCQTWSRRARNYFYAAALLSFVLSQTLATSVLAPSFETLVDEADLIFSGQALSQHAVWRKINGKKSIVTLVSFAVQHVHKGRAASVVTLQFLGGSVGEVTLDVSEIPKFTVGERVVLFVEKNGSNVSPLVGFYHGKFSLRTDATGRDAMLQHNGEALKDVSDLGRHKRASSATRTALSHAEFTGKVRERLSSAQKN